MGSGDVGKRFAKLLELVIVDMFAMPLSPPSIMWLFETSLLHLVLRYDLSRRSIKIHLCARVSNLYSSLNIFMFKFENSCVAMI